MLQKVHNGSTPIRDTRDTNTPPSEYQRNSLQVSWEFKESASIDLVIAHKYVVVKTISPWHDGSGGMPIQIAYAYNQEWRRYATSGDTWSEWMKTI